jgi:hypothetical protein
LNIKKEGVEKMKEKVYLIYGLDEGERIAPFTCWASSLDEALSVSGDASRYHIEISQKDFDTIESLEKDMFYLSMADFMNFDLYDLLEKRKNEIIEKYLD